MTCEKWFIPVPRLCDWAGSSRAARTVGLSGWRTGGVRDGGLMGAEEGGGAVHHAVRTCRRHQATSQICVWNPRSIRMGSTIKGTKKDGEEEREREGEKKKRALQTEPCMRVKNASTFAAQAVSGCCQIQTITQRDVRSSHFTKRLRAVYDSTVLLRNHCLKNWAKLNGSYLYI